MLLEMLELVLLRKLLVIVMPVLGLLVFLGMIPRLFLLLFMLVPQILFLP